MTDVSEEPEISADESASSAAPASRSHSKTVWALITVATLILTLSAIGTWVERQMLDTDNWVDASTALLDNDELRREISTYLVNELYSSVDIGAALADRLPEDLAGLGRPAASILRDPLIDSVDIVLQSRAVQGVWREANEQAHSAAIAILEDDLGAVVSTAEGTVAIDLGELVSQVGTELGISSDLLDRLPDDAGVVTIAQSDTLESAQTAVSAIKVLSVVLFLLVVVLYGIAIYLAADWRREAARNVGAAIAFAGFILLVIVQLATGWIIDGTATESGRTVARTTLPIATSLLSQIAWAVLFAGALIWLFTVLTGPSRFAEPVQRFSAAGFRHQAVAMWAGVAVVILLALSWGPFSAPDSWLGILFVVVIIVGGVEAIRRTSLARQFEAPPEPIESAPGG